MVVAAVVRESSRVMLWVTVGLIVVNAGLFVGMGVWGARLAFRSVSPRIRPIGGIVAVVCGAFLLGSLHRLGLQAVELGLLPDEVGVLLLADLQLVKSLLALSLGLVGFVLIRRVTVELGQVERTVRVFTERVVVDAAVSDLGLTPRELEVLEVIGQGRVSDREIAAALAVTPDTAKTHVRNVLRKAGVRRRQDLVVLVHGDRDRQQAS